MCGHRARRVSPRNSKREVEEQRARFPALLVAPAPHAGACWRPERLEAGQIRLGSETREPLVPRNRSDTSFAATYSMIFLCYVLYVRIQVDL